VYRATTHKEPSMSVSYPRSSLLLLLCVGCGLGDYEGRMDAERARVKLFDDENRLLGEMAEQPVEKVKDKDAGEVDRPVWPFEVFLRLPQGISGKIAGRYHGLISPPVPLFRYGAKDGLNVFIAAGLVAERTKENIYKANEWPSEDFRQNVRSGIREYYKKEYSFIPQNILRDAQPAKERKQPQSWRGENRPPLDFDKSTGNDSDNKLAKENSQFELYYHRLANRQVALIFQIPQKLANEKQTLDAIDLCLKSLDISDKAPERREALSSLLRRQGRKPS
jgi:hypothetical protein